MFFIIRFQAVLQMVFAKAVKCNKADKLNKFLAF